MLIYNISPAINNQPTQNVAKAINVSKIQQLKSYLGKRRCCELLRSQTQRLNENANSII